MLRLHPVAALRTSTSSEVVHLVHLYVFIGARLTRGPPVCNERARGGGIYIYMLY